MPSLPEGDFYDLYLNKTITDITYNRIIHTNRSYRAHSLMKEHYKLPICYMHLSQEVLIQIPLVQNIILLNSSWNPPCLLRRINHPHAKVN